MFKAFKVGKKVWFYGEGSYFRKLKLFEGKITHIKEDKCVLALSENDIAYCKLTDLYKTKEEALFDGANANENYRKKSIEALEFEKNKKIQEIVESYDKDIKIWKEMVYE